MDIARQHQERQEAKQLQIQQCPVKYLPVCFVLNCCNIVRFEDPGLQLHDFH